MRAYRKLPTEVVSQLLRVYTALRTVCTGQKGQMG